jgi:hypothetical protein
MNGDKRLDLGGEGDLYVERPCEVELRSLRLRGDQGKL